MAIAKLANLDQTAIAPIIGSSQFQFPEYMVEDGWNKGAIAPSIGGGRGADSDSDSATPESSPCLAQVLERSIDSRM
ncbi:MAG: hypothetical protein VKJ46_09010 [Leptolyngbyaceae bacterium]|nr:hypothetical protein [Leptolyngbyaceae bacterium]